MQVILLLNIAMLTYCINRVVKKQRSTNMKGGEEDEEENGDGRRRRKETVKYNEKKLQKDEWNKWKKLTSFIHSFRLFLLRFLKSSITQRRS